MKLTRKILLAIIVLAVVGATGYLVVLPTVTGLLFPTEISLTRAEIDAKRTVSPNPFVAASYDRTQMTDDQPRAQIDLKLFGLIKLKTVNVDVIPFDHLIAGGLPVGFVAKTDGVVVVHDANGFKRGDVITSWERSSIRSIGDFEKKLGKRNVGLWVKDETSGVGTLTYINPTNNNFAALGHMLVDYETGASVNLRSGQVYDCNIIGIEKSGHRRVGEYKSTLKKGSGGVQGSVLGSNTCGVYGCLNENCHLVTACHNHMYPVASRYSVKPGRATMLASLDGTTIREFDIEIIKTRYQRHLGGKGLIIRVVDPALLAETGGIIHGMSGSPIIQNGHLVGAVTHVMTGDVTKGYGVYVDFVKP